MPKVALSVTRNAKNNSSESLMMFLTFAYLPFKISV